MTYPHLAAERGCRGRLARCLAAERVRHGFSTRCLAVPDDIRHSVSVVARKLFFFTERFVSEVTSTEERPVYCRLEGFLY